MITVVTGPPCAGKTTYVQQHKRPGDIVIDFDALAQALGSYASHSHGKAVTEVTQAAWTAAVRQATQATQRAHDDQHTWIIDSRPGPRRTGLYTAAGARIVPLTAPAAELHRRADAAGRPASWHQHIDEFIAKDEAAASRRPVVQARTRW